MAHGANIRGLVRAARPSRLLGLVVLAAALGSPALPAEPQVDASLRSFAATVFRTAVSDPATLLLTQARKLDFYTDGFVYDTFEVRQPPNRSLGRITRLTVYTARDSTLDVLVSRDGSRITSLYPLEPVVFGGRPFEELPRFTAALTRRQASDYSVALSSLFRALPLAVAADTAEDLAEPVPAKPGDHPLAVIAQPAVAVGQPMPAFETRDISGRQVRSSELASRWTAVFFGELASSVSRDMLRIVGRLLRRKPGVELVCVAREPAAEAARHATAPDLEKPRLTGVLSDSEGALAKQFHVPMFPYLFVFDREGKLAYKSFWRGRQALDRELDSLGEMK